jgi:polyisoprenoid-binding protein YceI
MTVKLLRPLTLGLIAAALPVLAMAAPARWVVDQGASRIGFASSYSGEGFTGSFRQWSAIILFDPAQLAQSSIKVTVNTASLFTNDADRDETLPTGEWFDVKKFPTATFTSTGIKAAGPGRYAATGNLTIKGVTKPATLNFTLKITGDKADATGTLAVNRSLFNVGLGQFKGPEAIPHNVGVTTVIKATKAK